MSDPGITISVAPPRSMAGVNAFADHSARSMLQEEFGIDMPVTSRCVQSGGVSISCLAPGRFFVSSARDARLAARLARSLAGLAAVTDQSDMWATLIASGHGVREVLARVVPIDLGAAQFREGDVACTRAGHLDVRLWCIAPRCFEIAAVRSLFADLNYALQGC